MGRFGATASFSTSLAFIRRPTSLPGTSRLAVLGSRIEQVRDDARQPDFVFRAGT